MAVLESERNRVAESTGSTAPPPAMSAAQLAADPAKLAPNASGALPPTTSFANSPDLSGATMLMPVATAVAGNQLTQPARMDDSVAVPPLGQSAQLVFLLLTQVREGDGDAALTTARFYGTVLDAVAPSLGAADALRAERASLALALVDAPPSTRTALDLALNYVDDALALGPAAISPGTSPTLLVGDAPIPGPSHLASPSPASAVSTSSGSSGPNPLIGVNNGVTGTAVPTLNSAPASVPTHRPQTIGKPSLPVGGGPSLPVTVPGAGGGAIAPRVGAPGAPATHVVNPIVSMPVIARAPARVVPPKRVPTKSHGKIGK
jgi:hypothetical protein